MICCRALCGKVLPIAVLYGEFTPKLMAFAVVLAATVPLSAKAESAPNIEAHAGRDLAVFAPSASPHPEARVLPVPQTRWPQSGDGALWTRVMMSALLCGHARPLVDVVPRDVSKWCPAYADNPARLRAAFWAGFLSALAKHESTYAPGAVGGGGRWYGLLQILPATARFHGCHAGSGPALNNGAANLSCALRIMAHTVPRDRAIALRDTRWRGVAADWGPMRAPTKRNDMAVWLRQQPYCRTLKAARPRPRPVPWPPRRQP